MAKSTRSLRLNRETVRQLSDTEMRAAAIAGGGLITDVVLLITEVQEEVSELHVRQCPVWYCAG